MRSPIKWFGGKGRMAAKILKLFPPHRVYVEPFGGGAGVLFAKEPSPVEIYNDVNSGLVNLFRVLRDPKQFEQFQRLVSLTPYSREEVCSYRETWEKCDEDLERAYRWFVVARLSFGGYFGHSWGFAVRASNRGMSETCSTWLSAIEGLPQVHARLMRVQIEHSDFRRIIATYDTPETLFYCDPPYIPATRKSGRYKHEMTAEDHEELVALILGVKGAVVLSGYRHSAYDALERAGWQRHDYGTTCSAAGRTRATGMQGKGAALRMQPRTESIWISPRAASAKSRSTDLPLQLDHAQGAVSP